MINLDVTAMSALTYSYNIMMIDLILLCACMQLLYILGVYWAGPNIASAFQPIIPVWTTVLAILTCTEKIPSPLHVC